MAATNQYIIMLGCFDTKGEVFAYLRECLLAQGEQVITINTGVMGTTDYFPVDYEADQVAQGAGTTITELREKKDRGYAVEVMGKGAARIVANLRQTGHVKAVIGMGGGGGTYIVLSAMQEIPLGIPKLCLTTLATKDLSRQIGIKDITLMPSVVDLAGLNSMSQLLISQAAAAICAMARVPLPPRCTAGGAIAISMFGNTTPCVDRCSALLKEQGYEVFSFHATGVGGRTMEALIRENYFKAVLDITTTELADELCGGILSAGPGRLTAAAALGIPQVVVPGCLDMVNFAQLDTVPAHYQARKLYSWAPDVTLMRTNAEENSILGAKLVQKLNASTAAVTVVLPLKGISQLDAADGLFYAPEANAALFNAIKEHARAPVKVLEVDAHINEDRFAAVLVKVLLEMLAKNSADTKLINNEEHV